MILGIVVIVLLYFGDNWMMYVVVEQIWFGDIVVVVIMVECIDGYFGDLLVISFMVCGVCVFIIDVGVCDVKVLKEMGFLVWSCVISVKGIIKVMLGLVNVLVICVGVLVNLGDVIVVDDDGVVVVFVVDVVCVVEVVCKCEVLEGEKCVQLVVGVLGLDMYQMCVLLEVVGLKYID